MSNLLVSLYVFLRIWIFYFIFVLISNKGKENHLRNNELRCVKQEGIWTLQPGAIDMYIILYNVQLYMDKTLVPPMFLLLLGKIQLHGTLCWCPGLDNHWAALSTHAESNKWNNEIKNERITKATTRATANYPWVKPAMRMLFYQLDNKTLWNSEHSFCFFIIKLGFKKIYWSNIISIKLH